MTVPYSKFITATRVLVGVCALAIDASTNMVSRSLGIVCTSPDIIRRNSEHPSRTLVLLDRKRYNFENSTKTQQGGPMAEENPGVASGLVGMLNAFVDPMGLAKRVKAKL